ncbi:MAG TPA: ATP-dependent protease subunit HslV [Thermotogota bacterium]|nr:ATP-dependent protease subunit HslV [Thermotogota bacterium]HPJ89576.1 ATP-dependent protease subunit HslV [Thermotogota bacterium]HPR97079.1 ATP-dependent protease subunit HslV [Thermotogota bacterium]
MEFRGTTVLAIKKDGKTVIASDGQVTQGNTVMKATAKKVRKLGDGKVVAGFAGSVADAFTLFEKFEAYYKKFNSNLMRAAVELAKEWRTDKMLRQLEALLIVADVETMLVISGNGEVIQPDEDVTAIGSGGNYALAAARALMRNTDMGIKEMVVESMKIASEICIYTNSNLSVEEI